MASVYYNVVVDNFTFFCFRSLDNSRYEHFRDIYIVHILESPVLYLFSF